ncbi:MAG: hypothetical protein CMC82_02560 [Flavobacteriaceae bacterium]|nr:hypothetical protein [Flavobacteriaceae bacterium]
MIHENSKNCFHEIRGQLKGRRKDIYLTLLKRGKEMTDREVKDELGLGDMNAVRPRITELLKAERLWEVGETKCPVTGKTVRLVSTERRNNSPFQMSLL